MSALQKLRDWIGQGPDKEVSRWPGAAVRLSAGTKAGQIDFRRGVVSNVTDLSIFVEMDHPLYRAVKLMGDSYAHFCSNCSRTIPGNVTYRRPPEAIEHKGQLIPIRFFCPYCGPDHMLRMLRPGDKLRLHYRFAEDGSSGTWYAEVWEW